MDLGTTIDWSVRGSDAHLFEISDQGALTFRDPPDYDLPRDSGRDNDYQITVVAADADFGGNEGTLDFAITVTNLNEGPLVSGPSAFTINENGELPNAMCTADDPDDTSGTPTTIRWSTSGRDGGDFLIDENGVLTFRNPTDHERPADSNRGNEYELTVRAYDGRAYGTFDVKVTVREVNEPPVITGRDTFPYRVNGTGALYTYRTTDPERDEFTWSLGGSDAGHFAISELGGVLIFATAPDFESPAGSGTDGNEYFVTVQARDVNFNTGEFVITVTVTDQNEGPMVSGRGEISVQENSDPAQALASYSATEPEGLPITRWSLSGSDGGDFVISETGTLTFRNTPDYDRPADSNRDNIYLVTVRAYDGRVYGGLDVTVTVLSENEAAPVVTGRDTLTVRENRTSTLYTYRATDSDRKPCLCGRLRGRMGVRSPSTTAAPSLSATCPTRDSGGLWRQQRIRDNDRGTGCRGTSGNPGRHHYRDRRRRKTGDIGRHLLHLQRKRRPGRCDFHRPGSGGSDDHPSVVPVRFRRRRFHHRRNGGAHLPQHTGLRPAGRLQPGQRIPRYHTCIRRAVPRYPGHHGHGYRRERDRAGGHWPRYLLRPGEHHFHPVHLPRCRR